MLPSVQNLLDRLDKIEVALFTTRALAEETLKELAKLTALLETPGKVTGDD